MQKAPDFGSFSIYLQNSKHIKYIATASISAILSSSISLLRISFILYLISHRLSYYKLYSDEI